MGCCCTTNGSHRQLMMRMRITLCRRQPLKSISHCSPLDLSGLRSFLEMGPIDNDLEELAVADDPSLSYRPQQPADFFEFFSSNEQHLDMCPADDIMVSGKLLPLKDRRLPWTDESLIVGVGVNGQRRDTRCRRSESLSELKSIARSESIKTRAVRTSRSLDDRKRGHSHSSFVPELDRECSGKSDRSITSSSKVPKSRWQLMISRIGMVKFPPEMELRDIKIRQSRCSNPTTLFPATPRSEGKSPTSGNNGGGGSSWGLIKALSYMVPSTSLCVH